MAFDFPYLAFQVFIGVFTAEALMFLITRCLWDDDDDDSPDGFT